MWNNMFFGMHGFFISWGMCLVNILLFFPPLLFCLQKSVPAYKRCLRACNYCRVLIGINIDIGISITIVIGIGINISIRITNLPSSSLFCKKLIQKQISQINYETNQPTREWMANKQTWKPTNVPRNQWPSKQTNKQPSKNKKQKSIRKNEQTNKIVRRSSS